MPTQTKPNECVKCKAIFYSSILRNECDECIIEKFTENPDKFFSEMSTNGMPLYKNPPNPPLKINNTNLSTSESAKQKEVVFDVVEIKKLAETAQEIRNNVKNQPLYQVKRSIVDSLGVNVNFGFFSIKKPLNWWIDNTYASEDQLEVVETTQF